MLAATAKDCEGCGHVFSAAEVEKARKERDGELVEIVDKPKAKEKAPLGPKELKLLADWNQLVDEFREENAALRAAGKRLLSGQTCATRWRNATGRTWPPRGSTIPKLTQEELDYNATVYVEPAKGAQATIKGFDVRSLPSAMARHLEEWSL